MTKIRVYNIQTGQTGTIPEENFNPQKYERIPGGAPVLRSQQAEKKDGGFLNSKAIPIAGSILAGLIGSLIGPEGTVGGAAAGYAGADAARKSLADLMGTSRENANKPLQDVGDTALESGKAGLFQLFGEGLARGAGVLANPVKPFVSRVNKLVEASPAVVKVGELLDKLKGEVVKGLEQKGVGTAANEAYRQVAPDVQMAVQSLKEHIPARGNITEGFNLDLPVAKANQLKRNLTGSVKQFYGDEAKPRIELTKQIGRLLKEDIERQVPGVRLPNQIASVLYKIPEIAGDVADVIPFGAGKILRKVSGPTVNLLQKSSGLLRFLTPLLMRGLDVPPEQINLSPQNQDMTIQNYPYPTATPTPGVGRYLQN